MRTVRCAFRAAETLSSRNVVRGCYEEKRRCGVAPFSLLLREAVTSSIRMACRKTWPEGVAERRGRKAWLKDVAERRGQKTWPEGVAGRRGRKACLPESQNFFKW